jgi:predicted RNA-binding protein with EMAP domain
MEEQKNNSKVVKMQPMAGKKQDNTKQHEFSKEELKEMVNKLLNENRWLKNQLQQAQEFANTISRLDYLFKVVEFANREGKFNFNPDFVEACFMEIEKVMTPPEEKQETEDNKKN